MIGGESGAFFMLSVIGFACWGYCRYHHPAQFEDVRRAMRLVRHLMPRLLASAASVEEGTAPPIGIMGASAGGHLAGALLVHYQVQDADMPPPVQESEATHDYRDDVDLER